MNLDNSLKGAPCWVEVECWSLGERVRRRRIDLSCIHLTVERIVARTQAATRRLFNDTCGKCRERCGATRCDLATATYSKPPFLGLEHVADATWVLMTLEPLETGKKTEE